MNQPNLLNLVQNLIYDCIFPFLPCQSPNPLLLPSACFLWVIVICRAFASIPFGTRSLSTPCPHPAYAFTSPAFRGL